MAKLMIVDQNIDEIDDVVEYANNDDDEDDDKDDDIDYDDDMYQH